MSKASELLGLLEIKNPVRVKNNINQFQKQGELLLKALKPELDSKRYDVIENSLRKLGSELDSILVDIERGM